MDKPKLEAFIELLKNAGFQESDYQIRAGDEGSLEVSVTVPLEHTELPEELVPYAWREDEVERAIWKGNTEKKTWEGANFELALRSYAGELMESEPEIQELEARLKSQETMPTLEEYQTIRAQVWKRICEIPQIAAWDKELEEKYY